MIPTVYGYPKQGPDGSPFASTTKATTLARPLSAGPAAMVEGANLGRSSRPIFCPSSDEVTALGKPPHPPPPSGQAGGVGWPLFIWYLTNIKP